MIFSGGGFLTDYIARPITSTGQNLLNAKVAAIEADYPYDYTANVGAISDPMDWAQEGLSLAEAVAYVGITQDSTPSPTYLNTVMATAEQRMAAGGHRLADLLNTLFTPTPITLNILSSSDGNFAFSWNAISNSTYHVQWKHQLSDPTWNDLTNITASSNVAIFTEESSQPQRFYRVSQ